MEASYCIVKGVMSNGTRGLSDTKRGVHHFEDAEEVVLVKHRQSGIGRVEVNELR